MLNMVQPVRDREDQTIWIHHNSGVFSVKSLINASSISKSVDDELYKLSNKVWKGVAPPKTELLVWFVLIGRLNTRDRLIRMNFIDGSNDKCVLCDEFSENISHLFFS